MKRWRRGMTAGLVALALQGGVSATAAPGSLEFGPYVGHYGFDSLTRFEDFALFGARLGARFRPWLVAEAGFDEVYTSREITENRARQVSLTLRARIEPIEGALRPFALIGGAVVFLDDSEDPDAWGDALDLGGGLSYTLGSKWILRGEWVLRRQALQLIRPREPWRAEILWGRSLTVGVSRVF